MALPEDAAEQVLEAVGAVGGAESWGLRTVVAGQIHLDPGILVDELFSAVVKVLNDVMEHTPVERLAHVDPTAVGMPGPPRSANSHIPTSALRRPKKFDRSGFRIDYRVVWE